MTSQLMFSASQLHQHELREAARRSQMTSVAARRFSLSLRTLRVPFRAPTTARVSAPRVEVA